MDDRGLGPTKAIQNKKASRSVDVNLQHQLLHSAAMLLLYYYLLLQMKPFSDKCC